MQFVGVGHGEGRAVNEEQAVALQRVPVEVAVVAAVAVAHDCAHQLVEVADREPSAGLAVSGVGEVEFGTGGGARYRRCYRAGPAGGITGWWR
jgi:hypothetical protein